MSTPEERRRLAAAAAEQRKATIQQDPTADAIVAASLLIDSSKTHDQTQRSLAFNSISQPAIRNTIATSPKEPIFDRHGRQTNRRARTGGLRNKSMLTQSLRHG